MKNLINYYYGIIVEDYKKRENEFIFYISGREYVFIEYYEDKNKLIYIYSILKKCGKKTYEIILNKNNDIITYYDGVPYILLQKNIDLIDSINFDQIEEYDCVVYLNMNLNWKKLWIKKVDYYELQQEEMGDKYPLLKKALNYYLGLSEIAICLLNYIDYKNIKFYITHKRLENHDDLYNPLNIIVDNKTRDIAEFIKFKFFYGELDENEVVEFLKKQRLTKDEYILLLSRLIYPSYYFDIYEKAFKEKDYEKDLNKIIKKNTHYEVFLKKIYYKIKSINIIPSIEYLEF